MGIKKFGKVNPRMISFWKRPKSPTAFKTFPKSTIFRQRMMCETNRWSLLWSVRGWRSMCNHHTAVTNRGEHMFQGLMQTRSANGWWDITRPVNIVLACWIPSCDFIQLLEIKCVCWHFPIIYICQGVSFECYHKYFHFKICICWCTQFKLIMFLKNICNDL